MPRYKVAILRPDCRLSATVVRFLVACDEEAVIHMPLKDAGDAALNLMFAPRKSVFVDLLRRNVPVRDGRHEIDQFDNDDARYLLLLSDG